MTPRDYNTGDVKMCMKNEMFVKDAGEVYLK